MSAELKVPLAEAVRTMSAGTVEAVLDWRTQHELSLSNDGVLVVVQYNVRLPETH